MNLVTLKKKKGSRRSKTNANLWGREGGGNLAKTCARYDNWWKKEKSELERTSL